MCIYKHSFLPAPPLCFRPSLLLFFFWSVQCIPSTSHVFLFHTPPFFFIAKCLRRLSLWCALPLSPILFHLPLSPPVLKRQMRARWTDIWSGRKIKTGRNRKKKRGGGRVREGNRGAGKGRCVGEWGAAAKASQLEESEEQGDKEDSQRAGASRHPEERHWYPPLTPQYHSHHHHQHHLLSLFPFLPPLSASSTPLCSVSTELRLSGRLSQIS